MLTQSTSTVYNAAGQVQESIDALGHVTQTVYDKCGQAIETLQQPSSVTGRDVGVLGGLGALRCCRVASWVMRKT